MNVVAADTEDAARETLHAVKRNLAIGLFGRGQSLTDEQADQLLAQGAGHHVEGMLTHTAVGGRRSWPSTSRASGSSPTPTS